MQQKQTPWKPGLFEVKSARGKEGFNNDQHCPGTSPAQPFCPPWHQGEEGLGAERRADMFANPLF